jgi:hypothetical protein
MVKFVVDVVAVVVGDLDVWVCSENDGYFYYFLVSIFYLIIHGIVI